MIMPKGGFVLAQRWRRRSLLASDGSAVPRAPRNREKHRVLVIGLQQSIVLCVLGATPERPSFWNELPLDMVAMFSLSLARACVHRALLL